MTTDQYCQRQGCKHVELEQFLACFCVARVFQRQLGFLVLVCRVQHVMYECFAMSLSIVVIVTASLTVVDVLTTVMFH